MYLCIIYDNKIYLLSLFYLNCINIFYTVIYSYLQENNKLVILDTIVNKQLNYLSN